MGEKIGQKVPKNAKKSQNSFFQGAARSRRNRAKRSTYASTYMIYETNKTVTTVTVSYKGCAKLLEPWKNFTIMDKNSGNFFHINCS